MKRIIKKSIVAMILKVKKVTLPLKINFRKSKSKNKVVEFIGPSGVGKTTVYNNIKIDHKDQWYSRTDLRQLTKIDRTLIYNVSPDLNTIYSNLLVNKTSNVFLTNDNFKQKHKLFDFMSREMHADMAAKNSRLNKGLFSDDGFIHNYTTEIIQLFDSRAEKDIENGFKELFSGRYLIFLFGSEEYIANNLKERSEKFQRTNEEGLNDHFKKMDANELSQSIKASIQKKKKILEISKYYGAEILVLNIETGKDIEESINKFINYTYQ